MRTLPETYVDHGMTFRLVKRQGDAVMFQGTTPKNPNRLEFEVAVVQHHKDAVSPSGHIIPGGEFMPSKSRWGQLAWTCASRERTEIRFSQAVAISARMAIRVRRSPKLQPEPSGRVKTPDAGADALASKP